MLIFVSHASRAKEDEPRSISLSDLGFSDASSITHTLYEQSPPLHLVRIHTIKDPGSRNSGASLRLGGGEFTLLLWWTRRRRAVSQFIGRSTASSADAPGEGPFSYLGAASSRACRWRLGGVTTRILHGFPSSGLRFRGSGLRGSTLQVFASVRNFMFEKRNRIF